MKMRRAVLAVLALSVSLAAAVLLSYRPGIVQVVACDVGQGDAMFIQLGSTQILVDGGPDSKVMDCLGRYMNFWDRKLELVINTHPQKDHYGGLINVLDNYKVENILVSGLDSSNQGYRVLQRLVGGGGTRVLLAGNTQSMRLGLMHLDILHPKKSYISDNSSPLRINSMYPLSFFESDLDPNFFSVVAVISYKNFDILTTGDIETEISDLVAKKLPSYHIEYLKVPHHGSKNGLSKALLEALKPDFAAISVGKGNSYGHPNREILDMLDSFNVKTARTDMQGDIVVESDGNAWWAR